MTDDGTGGGDSPSNRLQRDPELFLRWIQFGAVSPLFRTHCTHCEIRPWLYPNYELLKAVYQFRSAMQPYIYSAQAAAAGLIGSADSSSGRGVLPCHPCYYDWPEEEDAFVYTGQYLFGPSLLVAPITTKADHYADDGDGARGPTATKDIWLPPGSWVDFNTAEVHAGPARLNQVPYKMSQIPMFARAGAVIPMRAPLEVLPQPNPLVLYAVGGGGDRSGRKKGSKVMTSSVYEDAGDGNNHASDAEEYRVTRIEQSTTAALLHVFPNDAGKGFKGELLERSYEVRYRCSVSPDSRCYSSLTFNGKSLPEVDPPSAHADTDTAKTLPASPCFWREAESPSVIRVTAFLPNITQGAGTRWSLAARY